MMARLASWRCWAIESAIKFRAATLSLWVVRTSVVRGGIESRGFEIKEASLLGVRVMAAREQDKSGGRVCDEEG